MKRITKEVKEQIFYLYHKGYLGKDIEKELNLGKGVAVYHINKAGLRSHKYVNKHAIEKHKEGILKLYYEGKTSVEIGKLVNIKPEVLNVYFRKNKLPSNYSKVRKLIIEDDKGLCQKCDEWKFLNEFQKGRVGTPKEYFYAYCNFCRNNQIKNRLRMDFGSYINTLAGRLRRKQSTLPFNLTKDYILELFTIQNGKCFYTDYELMFGQKVELCPNSLSIDKIIPELGYVKGNIVLCSVRANTIKTNQTLKELKEWMPNWYQRLRNAEFVSVVQ